MLVWVIAIAITIAILKRVKIETTPAKLAVGSLVVKIVAGLISLPFVALLGYMDRLASLANISSFVVALALSAWFFVRKSKLAMVGICIFFVFDAIGTVVMLRALPVGLLLGTAAGGVAAVVGLVSGIYCLSTWSTSVPNKVDVLKVFE
jgi:hypothetical protein